ncbi:uncharacterized protein L3040_006988 [Drepanopeziza brunnea f. sp. 'multigermtubi']|nr:hypothetical protein L3040_006988 [Drepanopeziza brunnea f. sp. 'multigermtubi']
MAGKGGKRKSESALPAGKSKQRKTLRGDDSGSEHAEAESDDQLFVQQEPDAPKPVTKGGATTRMSEPLKRSARVAAYVEDEGRMDGQQFLALVEFESKKKRRAAQATSKYMERLEDNIGLSEDHLRKLLRHLSADATKKDTDFIEAFKDAYAASRPLPPSQNTAGNSSGESSFATLYGRGKEILRTTQLNIQKFETLGAKTARIDTSGLMDNDWLADDEQTAGILETGRKYGLEKYAAMLRGSEDPVVEEEAAVYVGMIYRDLEADASRSWGRIAKKQEKSARRLYKAIAAEDAL